MRNHGQEKLHRLCEGWTQVPLGWYCSRHSDGGQHHAVHGLDTATLEVWKTCIAELRWARPNKTSCHRLVTAEGTAEHEKYRLALAVPWILWNPKCGPNRAHRPCIAQPDQAPFFVGLRPLTLASYVQALDSKEVMRGCMTKSYVVDNLLNYCIHKHAMRHFLLLSAPACGVPACTYSSRGSRSSQA